MSERTRSWLAGLAVLALAGCGADSLARRYEAERALYWADQEYVRLARADHSVSREDWLQVADRYEEIARAYRLDTTTGESEIARRIREISARAFFTSAQVHAAVHDSLWVDRVLDELATSVEGLPEVAGEVWLARGRVAENRGEIDQAVGWFEKIVELYPPRPGRPGIEGVVLDLPLRVARLRSRSADPRVASEAIQRAQSYYRKVEAHASEPLLRARALFARAEVRGVAGDWDAAAALFDSLGSRLAAMDRPPLEPADVALEALRARARAGVSATALEPLAERISELRRSRDAAGAAFLEVARRHADEGNVDAGLRWAARALQATRDTDLQSEAMFLEGQLFERSGRWTEAFKAFRQVQMAYPITAAALRAHLEITRHHARESDQESYDRAVANAEAELRSFIERFPLGTHTARAYEELIELLEIEGRPEEVVDELLAFADHVRGSSREPLLLMEAARRSAEELRDDARAAAILEELANRYPATRVGAWARREAERLHGSKP